MTTSMQFILWQILNTKCVVLNYGPHAPFILGNFSIAAFAHNCTLCLCVCVWLTGLINRQGVGGGRTPTPQIIDTILAENNASCSKKTGWWGSALQTDPPTPSI